MTLLLNILCRFHLNQGSAGGANPVRINSVEIALQKHGYHVAPPAAICRDRYRLRTCWWGAAFAGS
ncbi:MAG TPA: hypothetical protein VFZ27_14510 [Terriglobia bacterium]|nr:hypothetical protein [Terriglobia bacterium]